MRNFQPKNRRRGGFSLVELLAVIAIIGIMGAIIGVSLRPSEGAAMRAGQRTLSSMFQAARTIATTRNTEARVIIFADGDGVDAESKRLRYIGVVYWDDNGTPSNAGDDFWKPANAGTYLPGGIYYVPSDGDTISASPDASGTLLRSDNLPEPVMTVSFPTERGQDQDDWYFYAFDGSGNARSTDATPNAPRSYAGQIVVLAAGRPSGDGETILVDNPYSAMGLAVRRIGGTMVLNEYGYIEDAQSAN